MEQDYQNLGEKSQSFYLPQCVYCVVILFNVADIDISVFTGPVR